MGKEKTGGSSINPRGTLTHTSVFLKEVQLSTKDIAHSQYQLLFFKRN